MTKNIKKITFVLAVVMMLMIVITGITVITGIQRPTNSAWISKSWSTELVAGEYVDE